MTVPSRIGTWLAAVIVVMYPALIGGGVVFRGLPLARCMRSDHPARILLTLGFVLAVVWIVCAVALPERIRSKQWRWWAGAFATVVVGVLLIQWLEFVTPWTSDSVEWLVLQASAIVLPLIFLVSMVFRPFLGALRTDDIDLHQWGWLVSVLVMILAMFAFCVEWSTDSHAPSVKWAEVPAILIVFVLVETGVTLVALSRDAERGTRKAANSASEVAAEVLRARTALEQTGAEAKGTIAQLKVWASNYKQINDAAIDGSLEAAAALGRPDDVWRTLITFARSWQPRHEVSTETRRMLGELFVQFVGNDITDGTVRTSENAVACITADAVFAEASERWLKEMAGATDGSGLVVWALTTLLPTEFAFPAAYRSGGAIDAVRVRSLHQFTTAVMKCCALKESEYRRITVFEESKKDMLERLTAHSVESPCTLDGWLVLDERLLNLNGGRGKFDELKDAAIVAAQRTETCRFATSMSDLKDAFHSQPVAVDDKDSRPEIFPYYSSEPEHLWCFSIAPTDVFRMAFLGSTSDRWSTPGLKEQLMANGWLTLRDWYCDSLHRTNDPDGGAWWAVLDGSSADLLAEFALEWDSTQVTTLDLLLIGARDGTGRVRWHGAAISNLSFDRTECTVQLVTSDAKLGRIGDSVAKLCNGFKEPSRGVSTLPVERFGTWRSWPTPMWRKVASAPRVRAAFPQAVAPPPA
ncbi:MAG TPA: hypothetical protein VNN08_07885 [Thermoanaerobaculia bacterium]|nr:hypothetical protein [Thermoanaerobaculia bacterium]